MPYTRCIDANGFLTTRVHGVVTLQEINELVAEMKNYVSDGEFFEIVIHPDDAEVSLNSDESEVSADALRNSMTMIKRGAIAFVSNKDFIYGICRQLQLRVESVYFQICVFRSEETARAWLLEMKSSDKADW